MSSEVEKRMDQVIGRLLQAGVTLAALLVLAGAVLYLTRLPSVVDFRHFEGEPERYRTLPGICAAAMAFDGRAWIQLGLLVLIATPVARVVFSVFAFLRQRDWTYVLITLLVLGLLSYSLFGGHG